jgi:hypothetical protein
MVTISQGSPDGSHPSRRQGFQKKCRIRELLKIPGTFEKFMTPEELEKGRETGPAFGFARPRLRAASSDGDRAWRSAF